MSDAPKQQTEPTKLLLWAARWNQRGGHPRRHLLACEHSEVRHLFTTKRACERWIKEQYGYIALRKDLRDAPHNWRMPTAVRVVITIQDVK